MTQILEIRDLHVTLPIEGRDRTVVRNVSFSIGKEEAVALVGESGAGKSMTLRAIVGLLPTRALTKGDIYFDGTSLFTMSRSAFREVRQNRIGIVFQDPRSHINPLRKIGDFMTEALLASRRMSRNAARRKVTGLLDDVGVDNASGRLRQYPHELSGGLLQRVMIATALAMEPDVLLADEPTTALDVTTQSDVMAMLDELRRERGLALLLVTHDLELAAAVCDRTGVMYAGSLAEERASDELNSAAMHPYSAALSASRPDIDHRADRLMAIPGQPIPAFEAPDGCPFAPRCAYARDFCRESRPVLRPLKGGRVACVRAEELDLGEVQAKASNG